MIPRLNSAGFGFIQSIIDYARLFFEKMPLLMINPSLVLNLAPNTEVPGALVI